MTNESPWEFNSFVNLVSLKLGAGSKIRFWEDTWVGDIPFSEAFPRLFQLPTVQNYPISAVFSLHDLFVPGISSYSKT